MKCGKCQFENPPGMNFCVECGTELKLVCPKCNASNSPDHKFCGGCGNSLISPQEPRAQRDLSFDEKLAKIQKYLPSGLTEKILAQKDRIEGECWCEPVLHRLRGESTLALSTKNFSEAEACFQQALSIARHQSAKSWELRATISLSRLWQKQSEQDKARKTLWGVYNWLTEGFDTPDLSAATELLDGLAFAQ